MFMHKTIWLSAALAVAFLPPHAYGAFITNGGFESGLAGWTRADQTGSDGSFQLQSGTTSPLSGETVPAPPDGTTAAMSDAQGPGSHVLYQTFMVAAPVPSAFLVFDLFIGNRADRFVTPDTLDFATTALNQQARVDLLAGGSDPFSLAMTDVLLNAFRTNVGDPLISGYTRYSVDITGLVNGNLNTPLMLRFAEVDNVFSFQLGIDNVDIQVGQVVPEPASWLTLAGGLLALCWTGRRKRSL